MHSFVIGRSQMEKRSDIQSLESIALLRQWMYHMMASHSLRPRILHLLRYSRKISYIQFLQLYKTHIFCNHVPEKYFCVFSDMEIQTRKLVLHGSGSQWPNCEGYLQSQWKAHCCNNQTWCYCYMGFSITYAIMQIMI